MNKYLWIIAVAMLLVSCGTQKRIAAATKKANAARQQAEQERSALEGMESAVHAKMEKGGTDSALVADAYRPILDKLKTNLADVLDKANKITALAQNKANFNDRNYFSTKSPVRGDIGALDSFQRDEVYRKNIYGMVDEAISAEIFKRFNMAGFFAPGVYRIPVGKGADVFSESFKSVIDSIALQANKYAGIANNVNIVFVGYADATPIAKSDLYDELKVYCSEPEPTKEALNKVLSDLRARSLLQQMKLLMHENNSEFANYTKTRFSYIGYGKGEVLPPFKNNTDYTQDDERRRVVVCYWVVLPDKKAIK